MASWRGTVSSGKHHVSSRRLRLAAELLRLGAPPTAAEAPALAARVLAAAYGGWLYHLQRAHVRALAAARQEPVEAALRRAA